VLTAGGPVDISDISRSAHISAENDLRSRAGSAAGLSWRAAPVPLRVWGRAQAQLHDRDVTARSDQARPDRPIPGIPSDTRLFPRRLRVARKKWRPVDLYIENRRIAAESMGALPFLAPVVLSSKDLHSVSLI
jgi:hypothetical protein